MEGKDAAQPRATRQDQRRNHERLLDASLELFDRRGMDVSLREIAEHAGISESGMYRHFANRDRLVIEVYERAVTGLTEEVIAALSDEQADAAERLDALFDAVDRVMSSHPCYADLAVQGVRLTPNRPIDPRLAYAIGRLIADGQQAKLLSPDVSGQDLVVTAMTAAATKRQHPTPGGPGARVATILRRGLAPHASSVAPMPEAPRSAATRGDE